MLTHAGGAASLRDFGGNSAGATMEVLVKKWGNSAAVRIPAAVVAAAQLELDQPVDVREEQGRIVIEPRRGRVFALADLVDRISRANLHDPVDTGEAVGREAW